MSAPLLERKAALTYHVGVKWVGGGGGFLPIKLLINQAGEGLKIINNTIKTINKTIKKAERQRIDAFEL